MSSPAESNVVTLIVPASTGYLQLLRLNAAGVAGGAFDVDQIEDLKIAIEELAAVLMRAEHGAATLQLQLTLDAQGLSVVGRREVDDTSVEIDDFLATILDAVVDAYEFATIDGEARFAFEKHLRDR